eukprot:gene8257-9823_t
MSLKLIFETPVDFVALLLGAWLTLDQVSSLEVAMCSAQNRVNMEPVYEALIVENYALDGETQQLDLACITTALENSPSLRILRLSQAIVTDAILHRIATSPLDSLFMHGSTGYTEIGVVALMNGCTYLKKLVISNTFVNPVVKLLWEASRPGLQVTVV